MTRAYARKRRAGRKGFMSADGLLLVLVFALCGVGALAGIIVPERRNPALLAWVGSLAALAALWVSADVLRSGDVFKGELWTIQPLGTLTVSLDRLSGLFLLVAAVVVLRVRFFRRAIFIATWNTTV